MKNRKFGGLTVVILSAAAAILMAMPNAVLMRFADPNGPLYHYVSGFSMLPVGYGLWGAMAAGVGSVLLAVLGVLFCLKGSERLRKWMFGICLVSLLMCLSLLLFGSMTFISVLVAVLLAADAVVLYYMKNSD